MRGVLYLVLVIEEAHEHHGDIEIGDAAVCFDPETARFAYGPIERVIRYPWSGEMVRLQSDGLDSLSTPDHRVVLRRVQRGQGRYKLYDWTFCTAAQVPTNVCVPIGGAPIGPGLDDLTAEDARILGWIITDGNLHPAATTEPRLMLSQSWATTKLGRPIATEMDAILGKMQGVSKYERTGRVSVALGRTVRSGPSANWYFGGNSSAKYMRWLGDDIHRVPRKIIEEGSREQLEALFAGLVEGDGTSLNGRWNRFYPGHNGGLADDFQEVAIRLGIAATKQVATNGQWIVNIANERRMNWVRKPTREQYSGEVWDVTVPTGAFVARRNGKVFVTGNCPKERAGFGNENMSIHFAKKLATAGRSKGIRLIVVTHRVQSLHNAVLGSCDTLIAQRLTAPADQEPVIKWLKANASKEVVDKVSSSLSSLPTGSGWIVSGEAKLFERVTFPMITTFDNSRTPTKDTSAPAAVASAAIDLDKLRSLLEAAAPKESLGAGKAGGPGAKAQSFAPPAEAIAEAEQRGYERGLKEGRDHGVIAGFGEGIRLARKAIDDVATDENARAFRDRGVPVNVVKFTPETPATPIPVAKPARPAATHEKIGPAAEKLLDALGCYDNGLPTWLDVCIAAGMSHGNGYFYGGRKTLVDLGYVTEGARVVLTELGRHRIGGTMLPLSLETLLDRWKPKLKAPGPQMLAYVASVGSCSATVNRTMTEPLRKVLLRAEKVWKVRVGDIVWRTHLLAEPRERVREASQGEEAAIMAQLERGYDEAINSASTTVCAAWNVGLKKTDVDFFSRQFTVRGKGGRIRTIPMSDDTYAQLWRLKTIPRPSSSSPMSRLAPTRRKKISRGEHTRSRTQDCERRCGGPIEAAGVENFRPHDTRHTAATRVLRTSNLRVVQTLLGHKDVTTTTKYAHAMSEDVRTR
jgi:hypothetical protein